MFVPRPLGIDLNVLAASGDKAFKASGLVHVVHGIGSSFEFCIRNWMLLCGRLSDCYDCSQMLGMIDDDDDDEVSFAVAAFFFFSIHRVTTMRRVFKAQAVQVSLGCLGNTLLISCLSKTIAT